MKAGDKASFAGVLVNESHYREYSIDTAQIEDFRKNKDLYIKCDPSPLLPKSDTKSFLIGFGMGLLVTGLVALSLK